jgi:hypothetical protein
MRIPDMLMPHTVDLQAKTGTTATGTKWAAPVTVRASIEDTQELIRDLLGNEVVSSTTVFVDPENVIPAGSKVTVWKGLPNQRTALVLAVSSPSNTYLSHCKLKLE